MNVKELVAFGVAGVFFILLGVLLVTGFSFSDADFIGGSPVDDAGNPYEKAVCTFSIMRENLVFSSIDPVKSARCVSTSESCRVRSSLSFWDYVNPKGSMQLLSADGRNLGVQEVDLPFLDGITEEVTFEVCVSEDTLRYKYFSDTEKIHTDTVEVLK